MIFRREDDGSILNRIAEYKDNTLEPLFFEEEVRGSLHNFRSVLIGYGITFFFVGLYDIFGGATSHTALPIVLGGRGLVLLASLALYYLLGKRLGPNRVTLLIAAYELLAFAACASFMFLAPATSPVVHGMSVMLLVVSVFVMPGRWLYMAVVSTVMLVLYIVFSAFFMDAAHVSDLVTADLYVAIGYLLMLVFSHRVNRMSRMQFHKQSLLEKQSIIDKLTGIYNRARFDEALDEWTGLFQRYRTPFCLIMFDLDDYKRINDVFGHFIGDEVLRKVAAEVRRIIRAGDIFARWGGEEFIVLMPYNNLQTAYEQAERLRKRIEQIDLGDAGHITASFGVTEIKAGDNIDTLIQRVDKLMYLGKRSGKNIVIKSMDNPNVDTKS